MVSKSQQLANNPSEQRVLREQRDFFIRHVKFFLQNFELGIRVHPYQKLDSNKKKNALIFKIN